MAKPQQQNIPLENDSVNPKSKFWENATFSKRFFWIFFSISSLILVISAFDFPTNGDELYHIANGKANMKFYTSLGKDTSYINPPAQYKEGKDLYLMHYYGVFTDITGELFSNTLEKVGINYMDGRHVWNVLLALLGVFFTALTAQLFTRSWWAATLSVAIMLATPPFTGFTYNLTKDTPLATGFIISLYAIYRLFLDFNKPLNKKVLLILFIGLIVAIGNRVAGIMIFGYAGIFGVWAAYRNKKEMTAKEIRTKVLWVCGTLVAGYFAALLFWPYGLVSPIDHVKETFDIISKYPLKMTTFFEGSNMDINDAYWYFLPKYILITTPILFLIGLILSFLPFFKKEKGKPAYRITFLLLLFPSVFPLLYIIYKHSVVYQCWRHVLFVFPTMVVLSTLGWYHLMNNRKRWMFLLPVFVLLFIKPVWWMFQNHPYEYTYYNELVGGSKGAYEDYELDSYCFGIKNCIKWISEHNDIKRDTVVINCNDDYPAIFYSKKYMKWPVKITIGGFRSRSPKDWDYGVYSTLFLTKEERMKFYPPENYELVHAEYVEKDVPVYIVLKRKGRMDFDGIQAYEKNNFALADSLLGLYNKATQYYAPICTGMELMAKLNMQHFTEATTLYTDIQSKGLNTPEIDYYAALAYANKGELAKAKLMLSNAAENGLNDPNVYKIIQQIDQQLSRQGNMAPPQQAQ